MTIIDDDQPGHICFEEEKAITAIVEDEYAEVCIERINGSDGNVTVEVKTIELDNTENKARAGVDFEHID